MSAKHFMVSKLFLVTL